MEKFLGVSYRLVNRDPMLKIQNQGCFLIRFLHCSPLEVLAAETASQLYLLPSLQERSVAGRRKLLQTVVPSRLSMLHARFLYALLCTRGKTCVGLQQYCVGRKIHVRNKHGCRCKANGIIFPSLRALARRGLDQERLLRGTNSDRQRKDLSPCSTACPGGCQH